jgi:hypothetical protein
MGQVMIAEDRYANKMQFSSIDTAGAANVTTSTSAFAGKHVVITPVNNDAWIKIGSGTQTAATNQGKLITFGSSYTLTVRGGHEIASSQTVNVCPLGDA